MNFVGIDLHKKTISLCVVDQERNVLNRKRFYGSQPEQIRAFFERLGPFQAVVETDKVGLPTDRFVLDQLDTPEAQVAR